MQQLKSGFKRAINWNKYQTKVLTEGVNQYLDFLIDPRFQGVNILFVLSFENEGDRKVHAGYNLPKVETKDYNVLIDGENFFDQPVKNNTRTFDNIRKTSSGQGDEYTTGCLLDYNYFKEHYKMIAIYLSKEQELDCDPKAVQQVNFTGNLENQSKMFFFTEDAKETVLDFSQGLVQVFLFYFLVLYKMNEYNTLNAKLSNLQLNKLKSAIKNGTKVTLKSFIKCCWRL